MSGCQGQGGGGSPGLMLGRESLYSEVQCIMGNDHMGTPLDRQTHIPVKHYLLATSLAGGNNSRMAVLDLEAIVTAITLASDWLEKF